jgi:DNA polymerase III alpha subunit
MYPHLFENCKYPSQISDVPNKEKVSIVGKIIKVIKKKKKDGDPYLNLEVVNKDDIYTLVCWTEETKTYVDKLKEKEVVRIDGIVNHGFRKNQISVNKVHTLKECIRFGGKDI